MNTLLNLLSAAAVVVSGTWAVTPPVLQPTQAQVQPVYRPLAMVPGLISATESQGPWLTLDDEHRASELDPQPMEANQRWIF